MKRALLLLLLLALPAHAAQIYSLTTYRVELWRGQPTTIRHYLAERQAVIGLPTAYSNRRGAPAGLLLLEGRVVQGTTSRRCLFATDARGQDIYIGYRLPTWAWSAFQAGPCVFRVGEDYIIADEGFSPSFVGAITTRALFCTNERRTYIAVLRYRGSLYKVPAKMAGLGLDRCITLDGGSQLSTRAIQPAVLGILPEEE